MAYSVILHPEAEKEYLASFLWYEERSEGLGDRFAQVIDQKIQSILQNPLHYPEKRKKYREALTDVFPFLIVYKIYQKDEVIFITSIFHTSRRPGKKYRK